MWDPGPHPAGLAICQPDSNDNVGSAAAVFHLRSLFRVASNKKSGPSAVSPLRHVVGDQPEQFRVHEHVQDGRLGRVNFAGHPFSQISRTGSATLQDGRPAPAPVCVQLRRRAESVEAVVSEFRAQSGPCSDLSASALRGFLGQIQETEVAAGN